MKRLLFGTKVGEIDGGMWFHPKTVRKIYHENGGEDIYVKIKKESGLFRISQSTFCYLTPFPKEVVRELREKEKEADRAMRAEKGKRRDHP